MSLKTWCISFLGNTRMQPTALPLGPSTPLLRSSAQDINQVKYLPRVPTASLLLRSSTRYINLRCNLASHIYSAYQLHPYCCAAPLRTSTK